MKLNLQNGLMGKKLSCRNRQHLLWDTLWSMYAYREKLFNKIGYFRPELGRMKGSLVGIEDYEFVIRARRYGFKSKIVQNAVFLHFVPRQRLELKYFI